MPEAKRNLSSSRYSSWACEESSSLDAELSSAAAALDCTTLEICSSPCVTRESSWACSRQAFSISPTAAEMAFVFSTLSSTISETVCVSLAPSEMAEIALVIRPPVSFTACAVLEASEPTSAATTANPLPAAPALAASMEAFRARIFVCWAIDSIRLVISPILEEVSFT